MPAVQSSHSLCPDADWDCPFGQAVHVDTPCSLAMRPASQAVHDELPSESAKKPRVQLKHSVDAVKLYLPTGQFVQTTARLESLVLPASQFLQLELPFVSV